MDKQEGITERFVNFISIRLSQANMENETLKLKGKFNCLQAEYTQKRLAQDIGSWVIKNIIRADSEVKE